MTTPMMQQYYDAKGRHPGMLLLFRMGDFYELFEEDAEVASRILNIRLTSRDGQAPMAGIPHHALEVYLRRLIHAGHRVAICDQVEDSSAAKGLVRREVTRVVTPGTVTEDELLEPGAPNHLLAMWPHKSGYGLAWADLSTGAFQAADVPGGSLADEVSRLNAAECLLPESVAGSLRDETRAVLPRTLTTRPDWTFDPETAVEALKSQFRVATLTGFGFDDSQGCLVAAGAMVIYLQETLKSSLKHVLGLRPHTASESLTLDEVTRRSLELTRTLRDSARAGSLLAVLDRTVTPMGARRLHDALLAPLCEKAKIEARLDAVEELHGDNVLRSDLRGLLADGHDLQRLTARVSTGRATPRDLGSVARSLRLLPKLKAKLAGRRSAALAELEGRLELCPDLREALDGALVDDPPATAKEGNIIRDGHNAGLDELRALARDGKGWIARYQASEVTRTNIPSLKIGFNSQDKYFIEVTNAHTPKVPGEYRHCKTLKNAIRYTTPELSEYSEKILTAEDKIFGLEEDLFGELRERVAGETARLLGTAAALAELDFLASLAELASSRGYARPRIADGPVLNIQDGRHPVLDQTLPAGTFVPNDVTLGGDGGRLWVITGPNMSGKSTFIRQVALLTLMAHVGSFVPAADAEVGVTDRIFTRVGASDELSRGQSTFMVEMTEAANILNNATDRSLVILDEIGRGTSTYDGLSLAWAITEHLHDATGSRALFATHYHELAKLEGTLSSLRNYNVRVSDSGGEIVFLHKITAGAADRSYGIHVARLAGVPSSVLRRAEEVLGDLESPPKPARKKRKVADADIEVVEPPERQSPRRRKAKSEPGPDLFGSFEGPADP